MLHKYATLLRVLDSIRSEAAKTRHAPTYQGQVGDDESLNQARARAFIHLYLMVGFGLSSFEEREHYITDGTQDGGIDGYFIDKTSRTVTFIQSKFRTTAINFENKSIKLDEILSMDIDRILEGHRTDSRGIDYRGKIFQLTRELAELPDIGRYKYRVVILANIDDIPPDKLRKLVGGYPVEIIDHEACYQKLLFPVLSGTHFTATEVNIAIDLSSKNSGAKISYSVSTSYGECEITALFVPLGEIARVMNTYKNSILKYNPRSYLEFDGEKVNNAIRKTVTERKTNEFALFNNGITMLSDETFINERIGQKNKAQLLVRNPQIINGGQTAYTLSRILDEKGTEAEALFAGKEVLLKIITLVGEQGPDKDSDRLRLIDEISQATNQQTAVVGADRLANHPVHLQVQDALFSKYGLLYERKRGEFSDGIHNGYIDRTRVIPRNLFLRLYMASNGDVIRASRGRPFKKLKPSQFDVTPERLDRFYFGFLIAPQLAGGQVNDGVRKPEFYARLYAAVERYCTSDPEKLPAAVDSALANSSKDWEALLAEIAESGKYRASFIDEKTGQTAAVFSRKIWIRSEAFERDVRRHFSKKAE